MAAPAPLPGLAGPLGAELGRAIELAREAGELVRRLQRGDLGVELKPGDEPVSIADRRASELIVAGLAATFPGDPIISEELPPAPGAFGAPRLWLVDPIDGTKDYIRGEDGYAVMIGLVSGGQPAVGVVHQPAAARTFFASPAGAWVAVGDAAAPVVTALAVSGVAAAADARLVASKSHRSTEIDQVKARLGIAEEENVGSVGLKLCLIAAAARDLYVNPAAKTKAWDTCAPEAILARAGGRLTDLFGGAIEYRGDLHHRRGLVASNGHIHDEVVAKLAPLFPHLA